MPRLEDPRFTVGGGWSIMAHIHQGRLSMKSLIMSMGGMGLVMVFILIKGYSPAFAQITEDPLSTLEGIRRIYIDIPPINTKMDNKDKIQRRLLSRAEEAFRQAEIEMVPKEEYDRLKQSRRYPLGRFSISVTILDAETLGVKIYHVAVHLDQVVFLSRRPVIRFVGSTWELRKMGYSDDLEAFYNLVDKMVARFVEDFLSVNVNR
jgi:hypothetical protein